MEDLLRISLTKDGSITAIANLWLVLAIILICWASTRAWSWIRGHFEAEFDIDEVEIGIGVGKVKLSPSHEDLQMAYRLWVELKTRKLGLPFEEKHDVIVEIYNSWHEFFRITRELIKAIPVSKVRSQKSTRALIGVSIDVLNVAIRPHLTKWQARFRHWYELEVSKPANLDIPPQELQRRYPEYKELVTELRATNAHLVTYASTLSRILQVDPHGSK